MAFWDNVKELAGNAGSTAKGEIGDYLDNVISGTFARLQAPTQQQAQNSPAIAAAAAAPSANMKKYLIPAAVLLTVAVVLMARKGGK